MIHIPKQGEIYRHYKSSGGSDHTYQIVGIGRHSETGEVLFAYAPLYEETQASGDHHQTVQEFLDSAGAQFFLRPLSMWHENVEHHGQIIPRFSLLTE